jgi:hypothetical protein
LRELLTDACSQCRRVTLAWRAPLADLEEQVSAAEATIAQMSSNLANLRASVALWLEGVAAS